MLVNCNERPVLFTSNYPKAKKGPHSAECVFRVVWNIKPAIHLTHLRKKFPSGENWTCLCSAFLSPFNSYPSQIASTQEATRLLLLPLANCFLISNYQYIMRTKILCVQWPPAPSVRSSLTSELQCLIRVPLITPLTSILWQSCNDVRVWHILLWFSDEIIDCNSRHLCLY